MYKYHATLNHIFELILNIGILFSRRALDFNQSERQDYHTYLWRNMKNENLKFFIFKKHRAEIK